MSKYRIAESGIDMKEHWNSDLYIKLFCNFFEVIKLFLEKA